MDMAVDKQWVAYVAPVSPHALPHAHALPLARFALGSRCHSDKLVISRSVSNKPPMGSERNEIGVRRREPQPENSSSDGIIAVSICQDPGIYEAEVRSS